MARNTQKQFTETETETTNGKKPANDLIVYIQTKQGLRTLGRIGLFGNNNIQSKVANATEEQLSNLTKLLSFEVVEHGEQGTQTEVELDW